MHFTYDGNVGKQQLFQGDVFARTPEVEAILRTVHPHYFQSDSYQHFMLLTQSCDLVKRNGLCESRYLAVAAVRPFSLALTREIETQQFEAIERNLGFCSMARRVKIVGFVQRLLNNNEDRYFFLYREPSAGLLQDQCAFLQLSITLKAELHYDTLLGAKILQLKVPFQHKLGYLVGRMYSRVGTEDWVPDHKNDSEFVKMADSMVTEHSQTHWVDKEIHSRLVKSLALLPQEERTLDALRDHLKKTVAGKQERIAQAAEMVSTVLANVGVDADLVKKASHRLKGDVQFSQLLK